MVAEPGAVPPLNVSTPQFDVRLVLKETQHLDENMSRTIATMEQQKRSVESVVSFLTHVVIGLPMSWAGGAA